MIDLSTTINDDNWIISDTHFGHWRVLIFEPIRLEYLLDYNTDIISESTELLSLINSIPIDEQRNNERMTKLAKFLIPYHDEMLVEKWNNNIGVNDTVLHLGDFAFRGIDEITKRLNGNKILIRGNHDLKNARTYIEAGWKDVIENIKIVIGNNTFDLTPKIDRYWNGLFIEIDNKTVLFSHYPIFNNNEWDVKKYGKITDLLEEIFTDVSGEINIHGHTHTKNSIFSNSINVSLEHCTSLSPIKISSLLGDVKTCQ